MNIYPLNLNNDVRNDNFLPVTEEEGAIGKAIVNATFRVHEELGPGLLEEVYEICFCQVLADEGFSASRQIEMPVVFESQVF